MEGKEQGDGGEVESSAWPGHFVVFSICTITSTALVLCQSVHKVVKVASLLQYLVKLGEGFKGGDSKGGAAGPR